MNGLRIDLKGTEFAINLIDNGIYNQNSINRIRFKDNEDKKEIDHQSTDFTGFLQNEGIKKGRRP